MLTGILHTKLKRSFVINLPFKLNLTHFWRETKVDLGKFSDKRKKSQNIFQYETSVKLLFTLFSFSQKFVPEGKRMPLPEPRLQEPYYLQKEIELHCIPL